MASYEHCSSRRQVLKGAVAGISVAVGLPLLDCMLDNSGAALAATGAPIPTRFVSYLYGLGFTPGRWEPKEPGPLSALGPELQALDGLKHKVNVYGGLSAFLDSSPNVVHVSGAAALTTGAVPGSQAILPNSIDTLISDVIGQKTRFRSIEVSTTGSRESWSRRGTTVNPSEPSPLRLYQRLFGYEFRDPNAAEFAPDPKILLRKSALSGVSEERARLSRDLGASDRARLDAYFTAVRTLENQLALELERPPAMPACRVPDAAPPQTGSSWDVEEQLQRNRLFAQLVAHAFACGQTRVASLVLNMLSGYFTEPGRPDTHHIYTHEEPIDTAKGYQPKTAWFNQQSARAIAEFVSILDSFREGAGTVLDHSLVLIGTDVSYAKSHALENIPVLTAGAAGGRLKTGRYVRDGAAAVTKVSFTALQALGLPLSSFGVGANLSATPFSDLLA